MIPGQYIKLGKWLAIVALVGTVYVTIRNHGHAIAENDSLHDKLDLEIEQRQAAEALANDLSKKLETFQEIDREREIEIARARTRSHSAMRELENLRGNSDFGVCLATSVPASLADRVSEATSGLLLPDSP